MLQANIPPKFPLVWGAFAGNAYIRNIPTASQIGIQAGAASLTDGFPPLTCIPEAEGGIPPFGQDMNGILKQATQWCQWVQAGGPVFYDSSFSASIGGYPKGTVLASATFGYQWLNTTDANTTDPDTGGAGWIQISLVAPTTGVYNVRAAPYNAVGDGVADDTNAINQAATDAYNNSGFVYVPGGKYKVTNTIVIKTRCVGDSGFQNNAKANPTTCIFAGTNINGPTVELDARWATLEHISVFGWNNSSALGPAVALEGAGNCMLFDVAIKYGTYCLQVDTADNVFINTFATNAFASIAYTSVGANYFYRCEFDQSGQNWAQQSLSLWAANTPYAPNTRVFVGNSTNGIVLICTQAGTSGTVAPSTTNYAYSTAIPDGTGTLQWQIDCPYLSTYSGLYIDNGSSVIYLDGCDISGSMWNSIYLARGASTSLPVGTYVDKCSLAAIFWSINANSGSQLVVTASALAPLTNSSNTGGIVFGNNWDGDAIIVGNVFDILPGDFGILLAAGRNTKIIGNDFGGGGTAILVQPGIQEFIITGNQLGGTTDGNNSNALTIVTGSSDYYLVQGNLVHLAATGITDGGTGTHKSVTGNV